MMNARGLGPSGLSLILLLAPSPLVAQTFTYRFDELSRILQPGQKVAVMDQTGQETIGKVAELSPSQLVIRVPHSRTFLAADVVQIRRTDSNWDGVLIGLGAGYLATWGFVRYNCGPSGYDDECAAIAGMAGLAFLPGGALAGALIDRAIGNNAVYFGSRRATHRSLAVSPVVSKSTTGVSVLLRF